MELYEKARDGELFVVASEAVSQALLAGAQGGNHAPGDWRKELEWHFIHAIAHLRTAQDQWLGDDHNRDRLIEDLQHGLCRTAMAIACLQDKEKGQ